MRLLSTTLPIEEVVASTRAASPRMVTDSVIAPYLQNDTDARLLLDLELNASLFKGLEAGGAA